MEAEDVVQNSESMGDYLFEKLQQLKNHEIVGDVRGGKGLLCAVELVKNRETKEKFEPEFKLSDKATFFMKEHHLFGRAGDVIPIAPPLCINTDEIDHFVSQLDMVITKLEANF